MLTSFDRSAGGEPRLGALAWKRGQLAVRAWLVPVPDACAAEFEAIARAARAHVGPLAELDPGRLDLPACAEVMAEMRSRLVDGPGFAVLDRVPVEQYRREEGQAIGWILANLVGRIVAQKRDGTRLYDVRDTGKAIGHGVRRSITNLEQQFHTDGPWLPLTPSLVGLYCLQPAAEGGMSRCASLVTVDHALRDRLALVDRLRQPFWWDRQAEHAQGEAPCSRAPIYWDAGDRVEARYYDDYVRKGHALAGAPLDPSGAAALDAMREVIEAEESWIEFHLEQGQLLYLNNRQIAHSRTAFRDDDAKRHLMRFWNRDEGTPELEGGGSVR
ncbi:MAG: TauD/TfdA family dioxygenase [Geminicoccaceae bacterium]